jgi:hypothetical protein
MQLRHLPILVFTAALGACATKAPATDPAAPTVAPQATTVPNTNSAASADGSVNGEIVGTIVPGSRFSKLKIGMSMSEVRGLIKSPDDMNLHESGKRWIPFYYGNDVQRIETYYAGEGCLTFAGGNRFGGGGSELIRIAVDATKACFY